MATTKKTKRRKKTNLVYAIVIMILSLALAGLLAFVALGGSFYKPKVNGEYVRKIDVTSDVITAATLWINGVQGAEITADEMRDYIGKVYVDAEVSFKPSGSKNGSYSQTVSEQSYKASQDAVYEAVGNKLNELMVDRLIKAGYELELETTSIEETVEKAMGMSTADYLLKADIGLMPPLTKLKEEYDEKGGYVLEDNTLTVTTDRGEAVGLAVVTKDVVMFNDITYTRKEPENEK